MRPAPGHGTTGGRRRRVVVAVIAVVVLGLSGYTGYVGIAGAEDFIHPARSADCRTPEIQYDWTYQAINYDRATDAALRPRLVAGPAASAWECDGVPAPAGRDVVADDGTGIAGWYLPATSGVGPTGPTVLLAHGRSANKSEYLRYAISLRDAFNVVLVDLRNGGQSGGTETSLGVREARDVAAMLDWLVRVKGPRWIAVGGSSMGAAAVLAEAVGDPRVRALFLDSMHADVVTLAGTALGEMEHQPALPGAWAIVAVASLRLGTDVTAADPVRLIGRLGGRPVLLLHGTGDPFDPPALSAERNLRAALDAGVRATLWYCDGGGHEAVRDTCPAGWDGQVLAFLAASLGR